MAQPSPKRQRCEEAEDEGQAKQNGGASVYSDTNGMPRAEGRMLHLGLTDGELANRVVVVGHNSRAELLASFLKPEKPGGELFTLASDRGFLTYTGLIEGTKMSVVSIGMGMTMMDFFLREARSVVKGPMAVVRFGTCGVLQSSVKVGSISVSSEGSIAVQRNIAAFSTEDGKLCSNGKKQDPYVISEPCPSDKALTDSVVKALQEAIGVDSVVPGLNATADSFYCTQGRKDPFFADANEGLIAEVVRRYPSIVSMEMETFQLLHLARCCQPSGSIRATAAAVNVANRPTGAVVDGERLKAMERDGGEAIMKALVAATL